MLISTSRDIQFFPPPRKDQGATFTVQAGEQAAEEEVQSQQLDCKPEERNRL